RKRSSPGTPTGCRIPTRALRWAGEWCVVRTTYHSPRNKQAIGDAMLEIGVMAHHLDRDRCQAIRIAAEHGFHLVHLGALPESWLDGPGRAALEGTMRSTGVRITTLFVSFDGQSYANRETMARTVGLVQPSSRQHRLEVALRYPALARALGAESLAAHLGF